MRRLQRAMLVLILALPGCQAPASRPAADAESLSETVRVLSPREIRIQRYLTEAHAFPGSETPNGVTVLLAALDSFKDPIKCVGNFQFELYTHRPASGNPLGERVGYWSIELTDQSSIAKYWDRYSRFFKFDLKLSQGVLKPGKYILTATFTPPGGDRIEDRYEFETLAPVEGSH